MSCSIMVLEHLCSEMRGRGDRLLSRCLAHTHCAVNICWLSDYQETDGEASYVAGKHSGDSTKLALCHVLITVR